MASVTYGIGRYAHGLFLPQIRRDFALDTFTLGLIASIATVIYLLSNIVASAIVIHFKPRTFTVIGGAVTTLGLALVGIATNAPTAVAGILLAGAGAGIYTPAQFEAIFFFQSIGTIMGPIVFGWIAPRIGVVTVFLTLAALSVAVLPFFPSRVFDTSAPRPTEAWKRCVGYPPDVSSAKSDKNPQVA
jgi:MFS family permease